MKNKNDIIENLEVVKKTPKVIQRRKQVKVNKKARQTRIRLHKKKSGWKVYEVIRKKKYKYNKI